MYFDDASSTRVEEKPRELFSSKKAPTVATRPR